MLKLFKMLEQIVGQLEQLCLKLGIKNGYTPTVLNFKQQFVPQKWPRMERKVGDDHKWNVAADILLCEDEISWIKCDQTLES